MNNRFNVNVNSALHCYDLTQSTYNKLTDFITSVSGPVNLVKNSRLNKLHQVNRIDKEQSIHLDHQTVFPKLVQLLLKYVIIFRGQTLTEFLLATHTLTSIPNRRRRYAQMTTERYYLRYSHGKSRVG